MSEQPDIISGFKLPNLNVLLEENGHLLIMVYRPITLEVRKHPFRFTAVKFTSPSLVEC